jgi:hypothetical protein
MPSSRRYVRKVSGRGTRRALGVIARYLDTLVRGVRVRRLFLCDLLRVPVMI